MKGFFSAEGVTKDFIYILGVGFIFVSCVVWSLDVVAVPFGDVVNSMTWGLASGRVARGYGRGVIRVVGVGFRIYVRVREGIGGRIREVILGNIYLNVGDACISWCGASSPLGISQTWIRMPGVGKRACQAWGMVRPVASLGTVLRGRRRESCAAAKIIRFRGPVREIDCAGAR